MGVIIVLILGVVSFMKLTTDLLPSMELPYVVVFTTDPGASPESIEKNITIPIEQNLGTVNGVENVSSTSAENYSMVTLEFAENTDMNGAMVRLNSAIEMVKDVLPDSAGTPMIMEISMDMLSSFMISVDKDGFDIYELSKYVQNEIIPEIERIDGVASVSGSGIVTKSVEVRLNQDKIDAINDRILSKTSDKLEDARKELDDAEAEIEEQRANLDSSQATSTEQQDSTYSQLAQFTKMMNEAIATSASYDAQLTSLQTSKTALTAEKEAYEAQVIPAYDGINAMLASVAQMGAGGMLPENAVIPEGTTISSILADPDLVLFTNAKNALDILSGMNPEYPVDPETIDPQIVEANAQFTVENLTQMEQIINTRIPQIDSELANLETEIAAAKAAKEQVDAAVKEAEANYEQVEKSKMTAITAFGSAGGQIASASAQLESAKEQLESAREQYEDARKEALENANIDKLVDMETLSSVIMAENFDMPAGYIAGENGEYLLKVGDKIGSLEELVGLVLCNIDDIGDITLQDVADITIIDDGKDSYAKVNGNDAILLNISKTSTAGTAEVSKRVNKKIAALMESDSGLNITTFMDQGHYIDIIVDSVLKNLIFGAILAIIVLAIFLRDVRPTIVVAFSIPFSVLFAIVLMYFSNITLNIISLSGLALGIGMLVDNSIVVIENIYRLRNEGVPVYRAALTGTKQVAGAIASSTLTTVCVFVPIVFTTGLARQLFTDMALTIAYSLGASLIVAVTVVPSMSAAVLKKTKPKKHILFDKITSIYSKILRFCLRFKFIPILAAVGLMCFAAYKTVSMGVVLMPDMAGESISVSMSVPEGTSKEEAFEMADALLERYENIENVKTVGAMTSSTAAGMISSSVSSSMVDYDNYSFYIIPAEASVDKMNKLAKDIEEASLDCPGEVSVSASGMDMTSLLGSGLSVMIEGKDIDTLNKISADIKAMMEETEGLEDITDGQESADPSLKIVVDKNKAMQYGITVAQVLQELSGDLSTEKTSTVMEIEDGEYDVIVVDETDELTAEKLLDREFEYSDTDDDGNTQTKTVKLRDFASEKELAGVTSISRQNLVKYINVSASTKEGYNTTLISRKFSDKLSAYDVPDGYSVEIAGEYENVKETMGQLLMMIALAIVFIYLIMVAQFQSLLSPFIVIFTIPLAFTGGLLGMIIAGEQVSMLSMIGFLVLAGVIVNNGIVFVDYVNQLRIGGMEKKEALVKSGVTRMRPILMTALTTILAMITMLFGDDMGSEMGKGMAIVVISGLIYATVMTLIVVPVLYDIFFRKKKMKIREDEEEEISEGSGISESVE